VVCCVGGQVRPGGVGGLGGGGGSPFILTAVLVMGCTPYWCGISAVLACLGFGAMWNLGTAGTSWQCAAF